MVIIAFQKRVLMISEHNSCLYDTFFKCLFIKIPTRTAPYHPQVVPLDLGVGERGRHEALGQAVGREQHDVPEAPNRAQHRIPSTHQHLQHGHKVERSTRPVWGEVELRNPREMLENDVEVAVPRLHRGFKPLQRRHKVAYL